MNESSRLTETTSPKENFGKDFMSFGENKNTSQLEHFTFFTQPTKQKHFIESVPRSAV